MNHFNSKPISPDVLRDRALHAQRMMECRADGGGFRRIPEHSNQTSIVERYLIAAGDMKPLSVVPNDRRYRSVRRQKDERQQRRLAVMNKEAEVLKPTVYRGQDLTPSEQLIDQVLDAYKGAKSPAKLVFALVFRMGYASIAAYDKAATRAERFLAKTGSTQRMQRIPNHIRDKIVLKRIVEGCLAKRFGTQVPA